MNPMSVLQNLIMKGMGPQQIVKQLGNDNPIVSNLVGMAQSGNTKGIEDFARNLFKEKGRDFDKEFSEFRKTFQK